MTALHGKAQEQPSMTAIRVSIAIGVVTVGWSSRVDRVTLNGASLNVTEVPSYQTAAKMRDAGLKVELSQIVPLAVGSPTEENFPDC